MENVRQPKPMMGNQTKWSGAGDGRESHCPICHGRMGTGILMSHAGSARCLAKVSTDKLELTKEQYALLDMGRAYSEAVKAMVKREAL